MKHVWILLVLGLILVVEAKRARKKAAPNGYGNPWPRLPYPSKKTGDPKDFIYGHCSVMPNFGDAELREQIVGNIDLRQPLRGGPTEMRVNLTGFNVADDVTEHGFHIHEYGDLSQGCASAGGHYNPFGVFHGSPSDPPEFRHFGDLGNIKEDAVIGEVQAELKDYLVSLLGPFSVLGRGLVIHEGRDDLGRGRDAASARTGNAGSRLACCAIGLSDGSRWN